MDMDVIRTIKFNLKNGSILETPEGKGFHLGEFFLLSRAQGFCFLRYEDGEIIIPFGQIAFVTISSGATPINERTH
jgi:hypothetical protein